jgi:hypothetical protein
VIEARQQVDLRSPVEAMIKPVQFPLCNLVVQSKPRTRHRWQHQHRHTGIAVAGKRQAAQFQLGLSERNAWRALAHVINVLDPDVIVLGGGLSNLDRLCENEL